MLKLLIVVTFFWKTTLIYSKVLYLILNVQVPLKNFYFKLLNMCKFAHDRKTLKNYLSLLESTITMYYLHETHSQQANFEVIYLPSPKNLEARILHSLCTLELTTLISLVIYLPSPKNLEARILHSLCTLELTTLISLDMNKCVPLRSFGYL
jgi:hypothetical protein